ncbi:error-prone DNA polymerase [Flaviflexus salsibiostraticola]|uniref:Error-prone DNA polymerase n=1 Tax=Flaviflexus salsibiostraticola TaxID=1282737 RepID=A0A3S8Z6N3_9ACTO|nr:error-prone DNA polymerase [Flaviflexus salsibiostraticola]AZN29130.1 error-prone DNA polymerase [Flaviflexus salsibiostraticola]
MVGYAELHAHSAFSFLDGASLPEDLVSRAAELELSALALTDHDGLPGVVQLATAARTVGLPTVIGAELSLPLDGQVYAPKRAGDRDPDANHLVVLARGVEGYRRLSSAIGRAQLATGVKGSADYRLESLAEAAGGHWAILTGCRKGHVRRALATGGVEAARVQLDELAALFGRDNVIVELTDLGGPHDRERTSTLAALARDSGLRAVATGQVHYARPEERPLADTLAAIRSRTPLEELDAWLPASGAHLRSDGEMRAIHDRHEWAVDAAGELGEELAFDLQLVAPRLPPFPVPSGHTEASWLRELTYRGAERRYGPPGATPGAWKQIDHELATIETLGFPGYFLIVHELVDFCRRSGIFCQGRGSAANSAVCFALGITAVDAVRHKMLFERFLSPGRSGPPDIDIDIESGRREEVIQHVFERHGREHAAQVANVISYRPKMAIRDAGMALGFELGQVDAWSKSVERWGSLTSPAAGEEGLDSTDGIDPTVLSIAEQMLQLPRHLGIHSGGMVMCEGPVIDVCPVGWATAPGRTVLQWDKDDCAEAGLVKFDLLGLGMLTALRLAFTEIADYGAVDEEGRPYELHCVPAEDPAVYDLLCAADTVGVFQVESRAQMSTLPRLRPRVFYDIVVEVALIRPGPIQGNAVNPYIERRRGRQAVTYLHPLLKPALEKTLGVPLFQEQLMQIAVDAAGFSPEEADQLRKAIGSKRSHQRMEALHAKLVAGMAERGIEGETAEQIYDSLKAFADFGFPESHSFSFAYLVYASSWLKVHHPEAFYMGLLGAQPMGFYSPQSLVADARRHGVRTARPDINHSEVEASLERSTGRVPGEEAAPPVVEGNLVRPHPDRVLRLGLAAVKGLGEAADRIVAARRDGPFGTMADLARRCRLDERDLRILSEAGALTSIDVSRREGMWAAGPLGSEERLAHGWIQPTIPGTEVGVQAPALPEMTEAETIVADVVRTGISSVYPTVLVRDRLAGRGVLTVADILTAPLGTRLEVGGIVTHRQRPHTAKGTIFLSIEDETGLLNVVCSAGLWARHRDVARRSRALIVRGMVERADGTINFVADAFDHLPLALPVRSRDFR